MEEETLRIRETVGEIGMEVIKREGLFFRGI